MEAALFELIRHDQDRIMIIDLGPEDGTVMGRAGSIGVTPQESKRGATVVRSSEKQP
mgnify:FL=1